MLQKRASILKRIRLFFENRDYLELDTPLLSPDLIPESCLEVFQTQRLYPHGSRKENYSLWLIPSPEIWMKKIIAKHQVNVFQICKCFRNGESEGHLHSSEFTMLEYYTMNADYMASLALTEELIAFLQEGKKTILPFEKITIAQAFEKYAGFDLFAAAKDINAMETQARRLGLEPLPGMTTQQLYDLIFIHAVEPRLKTDKPVFLLDYPAFVPCLAKRNGDIVQRWELYWNGIELANCFSEETDPQKVKDFFINEEIAKQQISRVLHNIDHDYWKLFGNFPQCSGVAMGADRLIMALTGRSTIDGVLPTSLKRRTVDKQNE
ncbi:MAG: LysR family transcriptional regulator [Treponema sp.]|nr:LysR family transcriptional regulator [Treponema sp.]